MIAVKGKNLFILGGSLTGLALIRNSFSLAIPTILFSHVDEISTHSRLIKIVNVEDYGDKAFSAIKKISLQVERVFLLASSDDWLRFIFNYRDQINCLGIEVLHADNLVLDICLNKQRFNEWLLKEGLPMPLMIPVPDLELQNFSEVLDVLPYPLIVRPAITKHSENIFSLAKAQSVYDSNELKSCLRLFDKASVQPLITQSLIPFQCQQYSVAIVRSNDGMRSFVTEKIRPSVEYAQTGTYVSLSPAEDVELLARLVLDKLDYYGIAEVEILKRPDTGELFLIEINARPWLQYMLAWRSNHDFLHFLIDGEGYRKDLECKTGFHWIDFNADLFATFSSSMGCVRRRELSIFRYLYSLVQANVYASFSWYDFGPFKSQFLSLIQLFTRKSNNE